MSDLAQDERQDAHLHAELLGSLGGHLLHGLYLFLAEPRLVPLALVDELAVLEGRVDAVGPVLDFDGYWHVFARLDGALHLALADVAPWADLGEGRR